MLKILYKELNKKSKESRKMKKILIYLGQEKDKEEKLIKLLNTSDIEYSFIGDDDLSLKMSELLSKETKNSSKGEGHGFIYIDESDVEEIQKFDNLLKENNVDIPRKAIKTENNLSWTLGSLLKEVNDEYEYFCLKDEIHAIVMNPDREKLNTDGDYLRLMSMAFSLLEDDKAPKEVLEIALKALKSK